MDVMDHKSIDKDVPYFKDVVRLVLVVFFTFHPLLGRMQSIAASSFCFIGVNITPFGRKLTLFSTIPLFT